MTNINLYQSSTEEEAKKGKNFSFLDGTFIFSMSVFLLVVLASFGLNLYVKSLTKQGENLKNAIVLEEKQGVSSKDVGEADDFQGRLDAIAKKNATSVQATAILNKVAKTINSGVMINKFSFEQKTGKLQLTLFADSYRKIASQLFSFKNAEGEKKEKNFSQVEIGSIKRGEKGIDFEVAMVVN